MNRDPSLKPRPKGTQWLLVPNKVLGQICFSLYYIDYNLPKFTKFIILLAGANILIYFTDVSEKEDFLTRSQFLRTTIFSTSQSHCCVWMYRNAT